MFAKLPFAKRLIFNELTHTLPLTESSVEKLSSELKHVLENVKSDQNYKVPSKYCLQIANSLNNNRVRIQLLTMLLSLTL